MTYDLERGKLRRTTIFVYLQTSENFARYFQRPPDQLGPKHMRVERRINLFAHERPGVIAVPSDNGGLISGEHR